MKLPLLFAALALASGALAQNIGINSTGNTGHASAGLDVDFSNKGLLVPRVALTTATSATPISSPAVSLLVYNTATAGTGANAVAPGYYFWSGSRWSRLFDGRGSGWSTLGDAGTDPASNFLGTTDEEDLVLRTNNTERMRLWSDGRVSVGAPNDISLSTFYSVANGNDYALEGYTLGSGVAVYGQSQIDQGLSILGTALGEGGVGVYGEATEFEGIGMLGASRATAGIGVYGYGAKADAYAGLFLAINTNGAGNPTTTNVANYGLVARGQNVQSPTIITGGAGAMFAGRSTGLFSSVTNTNNGSSAIWAYGGVFSVYAETVTSNGTGVLGIAESGNLATGIWGDAPGSGSDVYGVWGTTSSTAPGAFAIYAQEDLGAGGTKSFMIDYPNDPENYYLKHFSIESDEVLNTYRGNVVLDDEGQAVVQLPEYFNAVNNDNISYHLTPIGAPVQIYVLSEVENGSFEIAGGNPGQKVSWMIMAERNDPYLQQNPQKRNALVPKGESSGTYLKPELYNASPEKQLKRRTKPEQRVIEDTRPPREILKQSKPALKTKID